jgi:arsenate reductase-like glutaredoxin family protein
MQRDYRPIGLVRDIHHELVGRRGAALNVDRPASTSIEILHRFASRDSYLERPLVVADQISQAAPSAIPTGG